MSIKQNNNINIAIVGCGNCASSLYQGIHYYSKYKDANGLMSNNIGGYNVDNIKITAVFDIDRRKVGKCYREALLSKPNCTQIFYNELEDGPIVQMGHILDGVSNIMKKYSDDEAFRASNKIPVDVARILKDTNTHILINYLPVGSQKATEFYANACLISKVSLLNCIPVFIASNPIWEKRFIDAGLPLIGDDMKSQFGASIISQMFQELAFSRGHNVKCHIQRNIGGNTDFLNMTDQNRIKSKKQSKENVIRSQNIINNVDTTEQFIHAGPSEYIKYYGDNKVVTDAEDLAILPAEPILNQNYPNPFNPITNISFSLPQDSKVDLNIYNIRGQKVRMLADSEFRVKGTQMIQWNGDDNYGKRASSGIYFYKLEVDNKTVDVKKCILLK